MNGLTNFLEKYFVPVAAKIGSQKHLVALRDAFISTMPITMAGSIAVLLNAFFRDFPTSWGWTGFVEAMQPLIGVNGYVWAATLAIVSLVFAVSLGYNLSKVYEVDRLAGALVSLAAFVMNLSQTVAVDPIKNAILAANPKADVSMIQPVWGFLDLNQVNGTGLFTAMLFGFISTIIYAKLMRANITIKMPDSVPPAVSKAFAAIIPALVALYVCAIIDWSFVKITGLDVITWISKTIQEPLLALSQGYGAVLLVTFLVQLLWFFGIHGPNVLAPVLESLWGTAQLNNINEAAKGVAGSDLPYQWVRGSFDAYVWIGGSGGTLVLIIALLMFSKRADSRTVAKLSLGPGIFNINEPIMFGLPIVLNSIYLIPFIIAPMVMVTVAYFATVWGLVAPVKIAVVWVMPPLINSFLATGGDWMAPVISLINMVIAFLIWVPFVITANKVGVPEEEMKS
ncbi:PTS system cellobiose-specific transporter subunit IIC [Listeria grandensis FSL F6-0971]|uniref:Permease IIC component n=1 Tax=Listeria grandensis FSL F6-0971 TaxID=1265819 RepID=W7B5R1_9LIST|nr:PTS sugar transporter subunit IIC [Listeria grandensis]EUJ22649.1 PTS system cellobiose-specific transporter subunit IIC [Listeria grandensis FSL F6-0971]